MTAAEAALRNSVPGAVREDVVDYVHERLERDRRLTLWTISPRTQWAIHRAVDAFRRRLYAKEQRQVNLVVEGSPDEVRDALAARYLVPSQFFSYYHEGEQVNATRVRRYPKREFHIQQIYVRGYPMQDGETPLYCHAEAFAPVRPAIHPNGEAQRLTEAVGKTSAVMYASGIAVLERECNEQETLLAAIGARRLGETVTIRTDPQADRRGSYGRLLVYLTHDGELFNRQLLRQGYARLYESEFSKRSSFADVEASAQRIAHGEIIPPVSEVHLRPTSD